MYMQHTQDLLSLSPFPPQPMYILKIWRKILTGLGFGVTCSYSSRPFLCTLVVSSPASSPSTGTCMHDMVCLEVELCCSLKLTTKVAPFWQGFEPQSLLQFEPVHNNVYSAITHFGYKEGPQDSLLGITTLVSITSVYLTLQTSLTRFLRFSPFVLT